MFISTPLCVAHGHKLFATSERSLRSLRQLKPVHRCSTPSLPWSRWRMTPTQDISSQVGKNIHLNGTQARFVPHLMRTPSAQSPPVRVAVPVLSPYWQHTRASARPKKRSKRVGASLTNVCAKFGLVFPSLVWIMFSLCRKKLRLRCVYVFSVQNSKSQRCSKIYRTLQ